MEQITIVGIDPGLSGAVTILEKQTSGEWTVSIYDVPVFKIHPKKTKTDYQVSEMANILREAKRPVVVRLESVHAMKGQGVTSMFNFGRGLGLWEGVCAGLGFDIEMITPQRWKKQWADKLIMPKVDRPDILKMDQKDYKKLSKAKQIEFDEIKKEYNRKKTKTKEAAKDAARSLASSLYPDLKEMFKLKKHDGRAESLLIAEQKRLEIANV